MAKITEKAKNFCKLYLENENATESYLKSFTIKDRKQRASCACNMLKKPEIIEYLKELKEQKYEMDNLSGIDKWKSKREKVIESMYDISQGTLYKPQDRIKARQVFLQNVAKYEETIKNNEEENEETLKNQFEVLEKMIEDNDLTEFVNVDLK